MKRMYPAKMARDVANKVAKMPAWAKGSPVNERTPKDRNSPIGPMWQTPANAELERLLAKPKGRKRVNSKPVEQGGVRYQSSTEAKFHSYAQLGMIPEFKGSHVISQPVFKLDADTKYTADFLIGGWCVVEVKSGKRNKRTGQPCAYWANEGARIRFKWARSRHPEYTFQVWVWDARAAQFVKVEG